YQLALTRDGAAWHLRTETGSITAFHEIGPDLYESPRGARLHTGAATRRVREPDGTLYTFLPVPGDVDRSLLTAITAPGGARLDFEYDLLGRLAAVRDAAGRVARYRYAPSGYLTEVQ